MSAPLLSWIGPITAVSSLMPPPPETLQLALRLNSGVTSSFVRTVAHSGHGATFCAVADRVLQSRCGTRGKARQERA